MGLWKADSKATLSLSGASLTRYGRGGNSSDTSAPPYNAHRSTLAHTRPFGCIRVTPRMAAVRVGPTLYKSAAVRVCRREQPARRDTPSDPRGAGQTRRRGGGGEGGEKGKEGDRGIGHT